MKIVFLSTFNCSLMEKLLLAERQYGPWPKGTKKKKTLVESSVLPQICFVIQVHITSVCFLPQATFDAIKSSSTENPNSILKTQCYKQLKVREVFPFCDFYFDLVLPKGQQHKAIEYCYQSHQCKLPKLEISSMSLSKFSPLCTQGM